jgi:hypothetical protein
LKNRKLGRDYNQDSLEDLAAEYELHPIIAREPWGSFTQEVIRSSAASFAFPNLTLHSIINIM